MGENCTFLWAFLSPQVTGSSIIFQVLQLTHPRPCIAARLAQIWYKDSEMDRWGDERWEHYCTVTHSQIFKRNGHKKVDGEYSHRKRALEVSLPERMPSNPGQNTNRNTRGKSLHLNKPCNCKLKLLLSLGHDAYSTFLFLVPQLWRLLTEMEKCTE